MNDMIDPDPDVRPEERPGDEDRSLRPQFLSEFIGQEGAKANLNESLGFPSE